LSEDQKHSLASPKFTVKSRRSCEAAVKAHECLQNLQDTKGSDVDKEVNTRFSDSTSSFAALAVSTESKSVPP